MPESAAEPVAAPGAFQRRFHARRGNLSHPYVRDLAWLLDAPGLLDEQEPQWHGRVATLFAHQGLEIDAWLTRLDADPAPLVELVERRAFKRLGRYAELLMAFFLEHIGALQAHGVQVRAATGETLGEFDFLLRDPQSRLVHWEFASKFYLLESAAAANRPEGLVGPNLADSLGAKMRKIMERQLGLSQRPEAQAQLDETPSLAQALVKGWLFYRHDDDPIPPGIHPAHCRGFWRPLGSFDEFPPQRYLVLPRLRWLAPARASLADSLDHAVARAALEAHFANESLPVMLAVVEQVGEGVLETARGFIVPDDWQGRAHQFVRQ